MSTILIIASVVLGCLIVGGIVFLWSIKRNDPLKPDYYSGPGYQDTLDLMSSENEDGTIEFENYNDETGAIYRPADGTVEVYFSKEDTWRATHKAANVYEAERIYWDVKVNMQEAFFKKELRTDLHYEYDGTFKVVRIFQTPEPPSLDHKLVGYEPAGSEAEAKAVVEKFRSENRNPILPRVEANIV